MIAGYTIDVREFVKDKKAPNGIRMINRFRQPSQQPLHGATEEERELEVIDKRGAKRKVKTPVIIVRRVVEKIYGPPIPVYIGLSQTLDELEDRYQGTISLHVTRKTRRRIRAAYSARFAELTIRGAKSSKVEAEKDRIALA